MATRPPLQDVSPLATLQHAVGIALREAEATGVLTKEAVFHITDRADEIVKALLTGKIIELDKQGLATIRDPDDEELAEMRQTPDQFPIALAAKKTLDV